MDLGFTFGIGFHLWHHLCVDIFFFFKTSPQAFRTLEIPTASGVSVLDAASIHHAMGKPQKMLLTAKKPKIDLVHPSDETMLVTRVALFNMLCPPSPGP